MIERADSIADEIHDSIQEHYEVGQLFPHIEEQNIRTIDILLKGGLYEETRENRKENKDSQTNQKTS